MTEMFVLDGKPGLFAAILLTIVLVVLTVVFIILRDMWLTFRGRK